MAAALKLDAATRALLDAGRGMLAAPLRAQPASPALAASVRGARLAAEHRQVRTAANAPVFMPRLRANVAALHAAYGYIALQARRGHHVSAAGEWLLDNIHVLAAQTDEVQDGLPRSYYRGLPVLAHGPAAGQPRIFAIAWAFVAEYDSAFSAATLVEFLRGYQEDGAHALTLGELWALPPTLRVVLIENLRRLAERVATEEAARQAAHHLCDQAAGEHIASTGFERMALRGVGTAFALQVMQRLHDDSDTGTLQGRASREAVRAALAEALPRPEEALQQQQADLLADSASVAHAVLALQRLSSADWRGIVGEVSALMQVLERSPLFAAEREDTQDTTLHAVERLARRCAQPEAEVAAVLLARMASPARVDAAGAPEPTEAAGHWISGAGRDELRRALGVQDAGWRRAATAARRHAFALYMVVGGLGTAALTAAFVVAAALPTTSAWMLSLVAALALWPASEVVASTLHRLCGEWARPRHAPRLALAEGIPAAHQVLVVVPALLTNARGIATLAARLEQHYLANREPHAQFALLTDWADADTPTRADDVALLDAAVAAIAVLEERHRQDHIGAPATRGMPAAPMQRFLLLHRARRWSPTERQWIGWERKRGKLEELIAWLAAAQGPAPAEQRADLLAERRANAARAGLAASPEAAFLDLGPCSRALQPTTYVLTLDSDTTLPPGALRELVAVAAHPLNRPRLDASGLRVVAGHAILQPRVDVAWPAPGEATPFHWLFAGAWGHDPYNAPSSEVFNDLFDEASFSGKGLLHVAALHAVLGGRLPEGQVLSHDLLEGAIARCGGVSDVRLLEAAPSHPDVAAARQHRWTRGDWQLLPLLRHPRRHGLSALSVWKMLDNLRRPLVPMFSLVLLALALLGGGVAPLAALALGIAAFGTGPLLAALAGLAPSRDDVALRHFARVAGAELARTLAGLVWQVALWPRTVLTLASAITLALWRSGFSRRHLLQWTTAEAVRAATQRLPPDRNRDADKDVGPNTQDGAAAREVPGHPAGRGTLASIGTVLRRHGAASAFFLVLLLLLHRAGMPLPPLTVALALLWAGLPLWTVWAGHARTQPRKLVNRTDRDYLLGVAHDTWRFFEQHVGAASHHLPPDNVQTVPHTIVAERTSPTNIGLYLLSVATARAFGWIDAPQMLARCEATLATLERLPRHRGHVVNWIDTRTLEAMAPAYVSTVDSGNLCVHLLALAAALEGAIADAEAAAPAVPAVGTRTGTAAAAAAAQDTGGPPGDLPQRLAAAAHRCRAFATATEFGFLYDMRRRLLHIGWRVEEQQLDSGYYDLLASEARVASLWAIAKGDVPAAHWSALGRPVQAAHGEVGLRSWSGSMFEYLMPGLVLDEPEGTLLARAARMAVSEQRRFARGHGLPWGVSECARAEVDATLAYQYGPQGVARLALRRTPPDERVVAPYASALAAVVSPRAAAVNLRRMEGLGARGRQGFIEALDFTPERLLAPTRCAPVHTLMAHHQGMALVALGVVLLEGLPRRWGMADRQLAAVASLLHERVPREVPRVRRPAPEAPAVGERLAALSASLLGLDVEPPGASALPPTQLLSNGRYAVALRPNGAGWSRWREADLTRWRDDALRDAYGSFIFLRRPGETRASSITQHPAPNAEAHYVWRFAADQAVFSATWPDLRVQCTVWVSARDDVEFRRIELWNTSGRAIELDLMSAFEVCLSRARADEMHPAFANLFVSARWNAGHQALMLARKPRRDDEQAMHAAHFIAHAGAGVAAARAVADRARWRGRLRRPWQPLAGLTAADAEEGARDTGLDPVAALALAVTLPPHGTTQVVFATAAAADAQVLQALVQRCRGATPADPLAGDDALLRVGPAASAADDRDWLRTLTTPLVLLLARPLATVGPGGCDRRAFWRFGVSGERPLISVRISQPQGMRMVQALVRGLAWWARGGVAVDLVVVNAEPHSYLMALQHELLALRDRQRVQAADSNFATPAGTGALHVWQASELTPAERTTLAVLARVRLHADGRPLAVHVGELAAWHEAALAEREAQDGAALADDAYHAAWPPAPSSLSSQPARQSASPPTAQPAPPRGMPGHFDAADGRFRFEARLSRPTPRPWINVLANEQFGAMVSESGAGFTWAGNSRLHQLTAWGNDALVDMQGEAFHVQDLRSRQVWQIGRAGPGAGARCTIEHGVGSSHIRQRLRPRGTPGREVHDGDARDGDDPHHGHPAAGGGIEARATWCVAHDRPIKRVQLTLGNTGPRSLELRVVGLLEWMMGSVLGDRRAVTTAHAALSDGAWPIDVLLATQHDGHEGCAGHTAFFAQCLAGTPYASSDDWTCDRRELFDARGHPVLPVAFGQRAGVGLDPCAALGVALRLAPGETKAVVFIIGHAASREAALALAQSEVTRDAAAAEAAALAHWRTLLGGVTVRTPDPLFDALVNHWLPYQTLACRLWARAGFYQAGGAYGFRDQLQDAMALTLAAPHLLREHLLRAAARQFIEGDVQHWWHPPGGAGARTRFSDDLLWLPHALLHYLRVSDDLAVLDESVPFIEGQALPAGAEDAYFVPRTSTHSASLYEHGALAIERSLAVGEHGLPLMGGGDWNDGMNRVGHGGRGESVWLAWFLCDVVAGYAPLAAARGEVERSRRWRAAARGWRRALGTEAWDGAWFRRAFFDDGTALGASARSECRIDLVAQAWSVLAGAAPLHRQRQAIASAERLLADPTLGLMRLLDPPLAEALPSAGYIQAYPIGVRENGGQYAHAGVWMAMAQARLGQADAAWRTFTWLSPAHRTAHPQWGAAYGLEPYVMAADVYSQPPYAGRGGWSWYTGSAGCMHRLAVEYLFGLEVAGTRLRLRPQLPSHWPGARLRVRVADRELTLTLCTDAAHEAAVAAYAEGATRLDVGRWLDTAGGQVGHHHVVICAACATVQTAAQEAPSMLSEA